MSTRGLIVVVFEDKVRIAHYNHFDSYPSGLGLGVLGFARELMDESIAPGGRMGEFKKRLKDVEFSVRSHTSNLYSTEGVDLLYGVLIGRIKSTVNSLDFANDLLFCEWAYVLDLDLGLLEVYKGVNTRQTEPYSRFYVSEPVYSVSGKGYWPASLVSIWKLSDLPTDSAFIEEAYRDYFARGDAK